MAALKTVRIGPIALSTTMTTNLLNPPAASGGVNGGASAQYIIARKITVSNKTATPAKFSLWLGATGANAAGTEIRTGKSVPANDSVEIFGAFRLDAADFLVGGSDTATALSLFVEGEQGVAG